MTQRKMIRIASWLKILNNAVDKEQHLSKAIKEADKLKRGFSQKVGYDKFRDLENKGLVIIYEGEGNRKFVKPLNRREYKTYEKSLRDELNKLKEMR